MEYAWVILNNYNSRNWIWCNKCRGQCNTFQATKFQLDREQCEEYIKKHNIDGHPLKIKISIAENDVI